MLKVSLVLIVLAGLLAPAVLFGGWVTMLCLGALAHIFSASTLAIAFWPSVLVSLIIGILFGSLGAGRN